MVLDVVNGEKICGQPGQVGWVIRGYRSRRPGGVVADTASGSVANIASCSCVVAVLSLLLLFLLSFRLPFVPRGWHAAVGSPEDTKRAPIRRLGGLGGGRSRAISGHVCL